MSSLADMSNEYFHAPAYHYYLDSTAGTNIFRFAVVLFGFALSNPSSSVAYAGNFYDGADSSGTKDIPLTLAVSESASDWYGDRGVYFLNGLYLNTTAGEALGSVFYRRVTWQPDAP